MSTKLAALAVLAAAAVTLTSVAAAGPDAARQRVAITMKGLPNGTFALTLLQSGALERDSGTAHIAYGDPRVVRREGQRVEIYRPTFTFEGKQGSLTIRERNEWVDTGNALVATGTWKVVRGTGEYAQITGGGRTAHVGHSRGQGPWFARQEGFLSSP